MESSAPLASGPEAVFREVMEDWAGLQGRRRSPVPEWESRLGAMREEVGSLKRTGRWRSGGRTLLHALGRHHDEVALCRGLAWLLTPDGWHGLGERLLIALLGELGLPADGAARATVTNEEVRGDARADIVVRAGPATVLIEAKVFAGEQGKQADRLAEGWDDEAPTLVFLTRDGRAPDTARASAGMWKQMSWADVARLLSGAVGEAPACAPGVRDYLQTLQRYGGAA